MIFSEEVHFEFGGYLRFAENWSRKKLKRIITKVTVSCGFWSSDVIVPYVFQNYAENMNVAQNESTIKNYM